jgi:hypothetical protein
MRYNTGALYIIYEGIYEKHAGLVERLHTFQTKHAEDRKSIEKFKYESGCCSADLADQYIIGAATQFQTDELE